MEKMRFLLDTDVVIDHLRKHSNLEDTMRPLAEKGAQFFVSIVTKAEVYAGKSAGAKTQQKAIAELLTLATTLYLDDATAELAGTLKRKYEVSLFDATIAATALNYNCVIITRNQKHCSLKYQPILLRRASRFSLENLAMV